MTRPSGGAGDGRAGGSTTVESLLAANRALEAANELLRATVRSLEERSLAHQVLLEVSRELLGARSESEVAELLAQAIGRLLPGRRFCLRIVEPRGHGLLHLRCDGQERPRDEAVLHFKEAAFRKLGLPEELRESAQVRIRPDYVAVYEDTHGGLAMPLVVGRRLHGLLNLEYPSSLPASREQDGLLLRPLVNQASVVLRKLGLLGETLVLKEHLEKVVESANALIVVLDEARTVRVFNREMVRLTGRSRETAVGLPFVDLLPEEERGRFSRVLINALCGAPTSRFETRLRGQGGVELPVAMNVAPVLTAAGEVEALILVGQDLTKMRDLERQVLHADKLATVGQLAAGVVHEVNTPLTAISVYAEYLLKKLGGDAAREDEVHKLRRIVDGAERIRHLTRELTAYARPVGGEVTPVCVNDVLRQSASLCEHLLEAARGRVRFALAPSLPRVYGSAGQLQQVFMNLLANACDATAEAGGGEIEVSSAYTGEAVAVSVRDHGPGVRTADLARVFEPFFSTKPSGKGTGLGLSIVREIVEGHGGRVTVDSEPDCGATFRVELPAERAVASVLSDSARSVL